MTLLEAVKSSDIFQPVPKDEANLRSMKAELKKKEWKIAELEDLKKYVDQLKATIAKIESGEKVKRPITKGRQDAIDRKRLEAADFKAAKEKFKSENLKEKFLAMVKPEIKKNLKEKPLEKALNDGYHYHYPAKVSIDDIECVVYTSGKYSISVAAHLKGGYSKAFYYVSKEFKTTAELIAAVTKFANSDMTFEELTA